MRNFAKWLRNANERFQSLLTNENGVVSIEAAIILPVMGAILLGSYAYGSVLMQKSRAYYSFYSTGDVISSKETAITCDFLDRVTTLAYEGYEYGNWGKLSARSPYYQDGWTDRGAEDLRLQIHGIRVLSPGDPDYNPNNARARILWSFHRTWNGIRRERMTEPGDYIDVPPAYRLPGEFYVLMEGRHFMRFPIDFGDKSKNDWRSLWEQGYQTYWSPRYQPEINLTGSETYDRCERINGEFSDSFS
ncbi:MAG: TadE family protein [Pseudomonadota bacterium]